MINNWKKKLYHKYWYFVFIYENHLDMSRGEYIPRQFICHEDNTFLNIHRREQCPFRIKKGLRPNPNIFVSTHIKYLWLNKQRSLKYDMSINNYMLLIYKNYQKCKKHLITYCLEYGNEFWGNFITKRMRTLLDNWQVFSFILRTYNVSEDE